jgi:hypothetical protein
VAVVIENVEATIKEKVLDADCPLMSLTCIVTLYVPGVDGVPLTIPVVVAKPTPCGNCPDRIVHV